MEKVKVWFYTCKRYYDLIGPRGGEAFSHRCSTATEFLVVQYSHLDELVDGLRGGLGFPPFLGHHL